jgi:hypothetical protein
MPEQPLLNLTKESLIPTFSQGFGGVGFLFGAGTSHEAGFPLMNGLTSNVALHLKDADKQIIETALNSYNAAHGTIYNGTLPDVEVLLDIIRSQRNANGYYDRCYNLESKIKELICNNLMSINQPNVEHHVKFLNYIKGKIGINHIPFWIFTTNYDLLFEVASACCKISLENGFCGTVLRYFDPDCLKRIRGDFGRQQKKGTIPFEPHKEAHIKLYKLHGSLSWYENDKQDFFEIFDSSLILESHKKTMIYPEHTKLDNTLAAPFDNLFTLSNKVIGSDVKYLVSCGYSYRDKHINDRLIIPKLKSGDLRIFALFETEPDCISELKEYRSFNYLTKDIVYIDGKTYEFQNNLWKFSQFVEFITQKEQQ